MENAVAPPVQTNSGIQGNNGSFAPLANPAANFAHVKRRSRGGVRKKPLPEVLPISLLWKLADQIEREEYKSLFAFCYLTGARVTEALLTEKRDIKFENPVGKGEVLVAHVYTEKRQDHPRRAIPLRLISFLDRMHTDERDAEEAFYNCVMSWWERAPDGKLWDLNRKTVWWWFQKIKIVLRATTPTGEIEHTFLFHPHYLRHCRATHLSPFLSDQELNGLFGWKSPSMAAIYSQLKGGNVLLKFQ